MTVTQAAVLALSQLARIPLWVAATPLTDTNYRGSANRSIFPSQQMMAYAQRAGTHLNEVRRRAERVPRM